MDEDPVVRNLVLETASNKVEQLRYYSQAMRYNGMLLGIARQILTPSYTHAGYRALKGQLQTDAPEQPGPTVERMEPAPHQRALLNAMVDLAQEQGAEVVFVLPPVYAPSDIRKQAEQLNVDLARELGVPLLDYRHHPDLADDPLCSRIGST